CDIVLPSPFVSRVHANIEYARRSFLLQPSGMNGTFLNDVELNKEDRVSLAVGDKIRIGPYLLSISPGDQEKAAEEQRLDLAKKFMELEALVHSQLLSRLDLRRESLASARQGDQNKWSEDHLKNVH